MQRPRREYGSGSISKRKDGTWTARLCIGKNANGKPKIKAFYAKSEREVKQKLKAYKIALAKNEVSLETKQTVGEYMQNWLYATKQNELKPKSFDRLEQTIKNQILPKIGWYKMCQLRAADIQKFINELKADGLSYSTVKKAYDAMQSCFRTGVVRRELPFNPASGCVMPRKESFTNNKPELQYYTRDEALALCRTAVSTYSNGKRIYRMGDAVILALNTGLRVAELLGLRWDSVSLENRKLCVERSRVLVKDRQNGGYTMLEQENGKTKSSNRIIDLNEASCNALRSLRNISQNDQYVLTTLEGMPMTGRYLDRMLRKITVASGIDKVYGFHALRHTFASQLFADGVDVKIISALLGHSDITLTYNTYIHLINQQKLRAVAGLNCGMSSYPSWSPKP